MLSEADQQLAIAIANNDPGGINEALAAGADKELRDESGKTPLLMALHGRHMDAAKALIAAGADVNAQDTISDSPFLYAGAEGFSEIVTLCMKAGADYTVYNRYGGSALIPACERGHVATVETILSDKSFPVNHINRLGWTALLEAVILGSGGEVHTEIVKKLIAAGADVDIADKDGVSSLMHAREKGQKEIVKLLEQAGAR